MIDRRKLLFTGVAAGAAVLTRAPSATAQPHAGHAPPSPLVPPTPSPAPKAPPRDRRGPTRQVSTSYTPVIVPNGSTLPHTVVDGVKVFHLVAEPVMHQIAPGLDIEAWGYNGSTPGPLIECVEGDRVRIYVTNALPEPTTVHWHGVILPCGMDGVAGLTQRPIPVGETYRYEFLMKHAGTFMYHPHFDEMTQIALGMVGMIVVHPRRASSRRVRDFALMAHEWYIPIGAKRPDPMAMSDFNVLTFNSKAFPATAPLVAEVGDLVRIRLGNLGPMDHHPIHLHGYAFRVVETDGGPVQRSAQRLETTTLLPVGAVRVIEFIADNPGDWAFHCHMTHHVMNQMGHRTANLVGANGQGLDGKVEGIVPGYMTMGTTGMGDMHRMPMPSNSISMLGSQGPFGNIDMGGMFTVVKVRDKIKGPGDPGWYSHPSGTVSIQASAEELARDQISIKKGST